MSLGYLVGVVLEVVVLDRAPVEAGLLNQRITILVELQLGEVLFEPIAKDWHAELVEAGQVALIAHDGYDWTDWFDVLSELAEANFEQSSELLERLAEFAFQQLDVLGSHFEGWGLEVPTARRYAEYEPEVYMDNVPFIIYEDVAVMPILDLQQICQQGVCCQRR